MRHLATIILITTLAASSHAAPPKVRGDLIDDPIAPTNAAPVSTPQVAPSSGANTNFPATGDLSFETLSGFSIELGSDVEVSTTNTAWADAQVNARIPAAIRSYNGKDVTVEGFLIPLTFDANKNITDFLLARNQTACCYGGTPQIHEFIVVHVRKGGIEAPMDVPLKVKGTLAVGPSRVDGALDSVYRMQTDGTKAISYTSP